MAIEIGELRARLTADAQNMKAGVKEVKKEFFDLGEQGKKAASDIKGLDNSLSQIGKSKEQIAKLTATLDSVNAKIEIQQRKLAGLKESYESAFSDKKKNLLQEKIVNTEAALLRLTNISDVTSQKIWALDDSLAQLGQASKQADSGIGVLDTTLKEANKETTDFKSKLSGLNSSLSDIGMNSKQIQKINEEIKKGNPQVLEQQLKAVREQLQALGVDAKEIDKISKGLDNANPKAKEHETQIKRLAIAYTALSVAIAAVIVKSVQAAASFEQDVADLAAAMNLPIERTDELKQSIVDLSLHAKQSIPEITKTMEALNISFGITGGELEALTKKTLDYARANKEEAAPSASLLSRVAQSLQMQYTDLPDLMDKLTYASHASGLSVNELGNLIIEAGPAFKSLGFSIDRTIGLFSQLNKMGAIPSEVIQPLNIALNNMAKDGAKNAEEAFTSLINKIKQAPGDLAAIGIASETFGARAGPKLASSIRAGRFEIDAWEEALKGAGGTVERVAGTQMDTLQTTLIEYHAALKAAEIDVGEKFVPTIRTATEVVTKLLLGFKDMSSANQNSLITFITVGAGVGLVSTAIYKLITALRALAAAGIAANAALIWIVGISIVLAAAASAYANYKTSVEEATKAQEEFNAVLSKTPTKLTSEELQRLQSDMEKINSLLKDRQEIEEQFLEIDKKQQEYSESQDQDKLSNLGIQADKLKNKLKDVNYELSKFDVKTPEDAARVLKDLNNQIKDAAPAVLELKRAEVSALTTKVQLVDKMDDLVGRYKELSSAQNLDQSQKNELKSVIKQMKEEYPDLIAVLDDEGKMHIQNEGLIYKQVAANKTMVGENARLYKEDLENFIKTYEAKIGIVEKDINTMMGSEAYQHSTNPEFFKHIQDQKDSIVGYQDAINDAKKMIQGITPGTWSGYKYEEDGYKGKEKKGKTAEQIQQEQYQAALKLIEYKKALHQMNESQELAALQKLEQIYKKNADIRMDLEVKVYQLKEQMSKKTFETSNEWIMQEERRMTLSGKTEKEIEQMKLNAWTRVRSRYEKDSELYKQADTQVYNAKVNLIKLATKAEEEAAKEREKLNKDNTKKAIDAIEKAKKAELAALDERKKAINKFYADQNESIDESERLKQRNELVAEMDKYQNATSEKGQKTYLDLKEKLRLHDQENTKRGLAKERDQKLEALEKEKQNIESWYDELKDATGDLTKDLTKLYKLADDERLKSFVTTNAKIVAEMNNLKAAMAGSSTSSTSTGGVNSSSVIAQMKANSATWSGASADEKKRLDQDNLNLGTSQGWIRKPDGHWYQPDGKLVYHTGGIAGEMNFRSGDMLMPNEINAVLKRGEPVLTPQQIGSLVGAGGGGDTTINIEKIMEVIEPRFEDGIDLRAFGRETGETTAAILRTKKSWATSGQ